MQGRQLGMGQGRGAPFIVLLFLTLAWKVAGGELIGSTPSSQSGDKPQFIKPGATVLVLGSGGLVGSALTAELRLQGYNVLEAKNRLHIDLRVPGTLDVFNSSHIDFCFFLACEVGGSKFISSGDNEAPIKRHNEKMYEVVLPYLQERKIPFIFSSSQLSVTATAYGKVKALGEELITKMEPPPNTPRLAKFLRFWNVWGGEKIGLRSHILPDWIFQCVQHGHVQSHTSGWEQRQFVHADDMAVALVDLMLSFDKLPVRIDITSSEWISMRQLAAVLGQHGTRPCTFHFGQKNSSTMIGVEPENLWKVSSNLHERVSQEFRFFQAMAYREAYAQHSNDGVYISFIIASTNDNYNGIRKRTFNFLTALAKSAELTHLDYELIVVQYNPKVQTTYWEDNFFLKDPTSDRDLTFSQLFPWTGPRSFGNMRIITVPSHLHRWADKGPFWEYVAKNVGAVRARGKFLFFTNPDNVFPVTLFEQLSKQQLDPTKIYKSGIISNFGGAGSTEGMVNACNRISAAMCGPKPMWQPMPADMQQVLDTYRDDVYIENGKPHWEPSMVGDFSIFPRDVFVKEGYFETPQNTHIETWHLFRVTREDRIKLVALDDVGCHQQHTRDGRPAVPLSGNDLTVLYANRSAEELAQIGLPHVRLPEARMYDVLDAAFNPEAPFLTFPHHHLFRMFEGRLYTGPVLEHYVTDFLGVHTSYHFDCADSGRYRFYHLSRRFPCARHEEYWRRNYTESGLDVLGDLPVVDEEYLEWLTMLRAVQRALPTPVYKPFVVMELGARYGTWTVRAGAAMRRLQPHRPLKLAAVEADPSGFEWLNSHLETNQLASAARTIKGFVMDRKDVVKFQPWERTSTDSNVTSYTLEELLAEYDEVDVIHCDIQGWERVFIPNIELMNAKVKAIHFGTHSTDLHNDLRKVFVANNWTVTADMLDNGGKKHGRLENTPQGPIRILWDGVLAFENTAKFSQAQGAHLHRGIIRDSSLGSSGLFRAARPGGWAKR